MCSIESLWVPLWPVPGTFFSPRETDCKAGGTRVRKRLNIVYRAFIQIQTPTTARLMADEISIISRDIFSRASWETCCRTTRWGLRSKHLSEAFSQGSGLQALLTRVSNDLLMAPVAGSASDLLPLMPSSTTPSGFGTALQWVWSDLSGETKCVSIRGVKAKCQLSSVEFLKDQSVAPFSSTYICCSPVNSYWISFHSDGDHKQQPKPSNCIFEIPSKGPTETF